MRNGTRCLALGLGFLMRGPDASGDGCFVWNQGADLKEPSQKAILCLRDGVETLVLQVKYEGRAEDFAWIVPLPAKPRVDAIDADASPFPEISLYTQLRRRWGYRGRLKEDGGEPPGPVDVLERKVAGVYDVAVLAGKNAAALTDWLNGNGYAFPRQRADILDHYARKGWVYAALRIARDALDRDEVRKLRVGELQPVRFTFPTEEMVYPLKISSINAGETEVLLYVLADAPMHVVNDGRRPGFSIADNLAPSESFQDPAHGTWRKADGMELPLTWKALQLPTNIRHSLCTYREIWRTEDMQEDLRFAAFDAQAYWRREMQEAGDQDWRRQRALSVLAAADSDALRTLAQSSNETSRVLAAAALNPRSPEEILRDLSRDARDAVREAVAANPRVSGTLLAELVADTSVRVRDAVARNPATPPEVLQQLAHQPERAGSVARNPGLPVDLLRELAAQEDAGVRAAIAGHPAAPEGILLQLARDENPAVRQRLLALPARPMALLKRLAEDPDPAVRRQLARYKGLPVPIVAGLLRDPDPGVRVAVAHNDTLWGRNGWIDAARALARDAEEDVRLAMAAHPHAGEEVLRTLVSDPIREVRRAVGENATCPPAVLGALAGDADAYVRRIIAGKETTPIAVLVRLAADEDEAVRRSLILNRRAPAEAIDRMAHDSSEDIRTRVAGDDRVSPGVLAALARDESGKVRVVVAWNPKTPADTLALLANDETATVRLQVCRNMNTSADLLTRLAGDKAFDVRWAVVRESRAPAEALRKIWQYPESRTRGLGPGIAEHPHAPADLLEALAGHSDFYTRQALAKRRDLSARLLGRLAGDEESGVRYTVAVNEVTPPDILRNLARDGNPDVRKAVAHNPTAPTDVLQQLARDATATVSEPARRQLERRNSASKE